MSKSNDQASTSATPYGTPEYYGVKASTVYGGADYYVLGVNPHTQNVRKG